jgi:hypothetical protein
MTGRGLRYCGTTVVEPGRCETLREHTAESDRVQDAALLRLQGCQREQLPQQPPPERCAWGARRVLRYRLSAGCSHAAVSSPAVAERVCVVQDAAALFCSGCHHPAVAHATADYTAAVFSRAWGASGVCCALAGVSLLSGPAAAA